MLSNKLFNVLLLNITDDSLKLAIISECFSVTVNSNKEPEIVNVMTIIILMTLK